MAVYVVMYLRPRRPLCIFDGRSATTARLGRGTPGASRPIRAKQCRRKRRRVPSPQASSLYTQSTTAIPACPRYQRSISEMAPAPPESGLHRPSPRSIRPVARVLEVPRSLQTEPFKKRVTLSLRHAHVEQFGLLCLMWYLSWVASGLDVFSRRHARRATVSTPRYDSVQSLRFLPLEIQSLLSA